MKVLSFREVIVNIKQGEAWNCEGYRIRCMENGNIEITTPTLRTIGFTKEDEFKIERKECAFQEAFKAYEDGKEIESCKHRYKKTCGIDRYHLKTTDEWWKNESGFDFEEIRGKWYIND